MARSSERSAFNNVDLPMLGNPKIVTRAHLWVEDILLFSLLPSSSSIVWLLSSSSKEVMASSCDDDETLEDILPSYSNFDSSSKRSSFCVSLGVPSSTSLYLSLPDRCDLNSLLQPSVLLVVDGNDDCKKFNVL